MVLVATVADTHIAARIDGVIGLVKLNPVSTDGTRATADLCIALDHSFQAGPAREAVTKHKGWRLVGIAIGRCFSQHGGLLQIQWRLCLWLVRCSFREYRCGCQRLCKRGPAAHQPQRGR